MDAALDACRNLVSVSTVFLSVKISEKVFYGTLFFYPSTQQIKTAVFKFRHTNSVTAKLFLGLRFVVTEEKNSKRDPTVNVLFNPAYC